VPNFFSRPDANARSGLCRLLVACVFTGALALPAVALAAPAVSVDKTSGPVGTVVSLTAAPCPAPVGAVAWTAIVRFAQGANPAISFANFSIAANGNWAGQFTIPTGAGPGNAQLTAQCFDASHAVQTTVDYAPVSFSVTPSALGAHETSGPVGTTFALSPDLCPAPAGVGAWTAIVQFAQGGNPALSFKNFTIASGGSWSGLFAIPTGAVPGIAQLTAQCFDASHTVQTTVDYAAQPFEVTQSELGATPVSEPVGTSVTLSPDACPAPVGAGAWTALVKFAQGANSELSFANYPVAADGSWSGQFTIPIVAADGSAQLVALCFDASHTVQTTVDYAPVSFLVTPTEPGGGGGGDGGGGGGPPPGNTPELDSLLLFGSGLAGLAGLARLRFLSARRKRTRR
jgi:hypothetical protein